MVVPSPDSSTVERVQQIASKGHERHLGSKELGLRAKLTSIMYGCWFTLTTGENRHAGPI